MPRLLNLLPTLAKVNAHLAFCVAARRAADLHAAHNKNRLAGAALPSPAHGRRRRWACGSLAGVYRAQVRACACMPQLGWTRSAFKGSPWPSKHQTRLRPVLQEMAECQPPPQSSH